MRPVRRTILGPWQRRVLTALATAVTGVGLGIALHAPVQYALLRRQLASPDETVRSDGIVRAAVLASRSEDVADRLRRELDGDDDAMFAAALESLIAAGRMRLADLDAASIDRLAVVELADMIRRPPPVSEEVFEGRRWRLVTQVLVRRREGPHVARAARLGADDASPLVRRVAGGLAGRTRQTDILEKLLGDEDGQVRAAAARWSALAGLSELAPAIEPLLADGEADVAASAAWALAALAPGEYSARLGEMLTQTGDAALADRLAGVMVVLGDEPARRAVGARLEAAGYSPSPALLAAAGRLKLPEAAPVATRVLELAAGTYSGELDEPLELPAGLLHAAMAAAGELDLPLGQTYAYLANRLIHPDYDALAARAIGLLGGQLRAGRLDESFSQICTQFLRGSARFIQTSSDGGGSPRMNLSLEDSSAPASSARAAVELCLLAWSRDLGEGGELSADAAALRTAVRHAASRHATLSGDVLAVRLGVVGGDEAFALGLWMLPELHPPQELGQPNERVRAAGAMLLALSARGDQQRQQARQRLSLRLRGGRAGLETTLEVIETYELALAIVDQDYLVDARALLEAGYWPARGVLLTTAGGNGAGLDWLLWGPNLTDDRSLEILIDEQLAPLLELLAPGLPTVEPWADAELADWQLRLMQEAWAMRGPQGLKGR